MSIEKQFQSAVVPLIASGKHTFNVAYSGGVDSLVLLYLTHQLKAEFPHLNIQAIHINHGLNPNADLWQRHCQEYCQTLGLAFLTEKIEVDAQSGKGLEAAARDARYQALLGLCQPGSVLMLGQHQNDQLETILLQLKRGAGPRGLSAMATQSLGPEDVQIIRPLLTCGRSEIELYASGHGLSWVEDDSNQSLDFDRNFLRHEVIPLLEQRWPGMASAASRSARHCASQQSLLDEVCLTRLADMKTADGGVKITGLMAQTVAWRAEIIRCWLMKQNADMPSEKVLEQFFKQMAAKEDANPVISWGKWQLRRFQETLYVMEQLPPAVPFSAPLTNGLEVELLDELGVLNVTCEETATKSALSIHYDTFSRRFKPVGEAVSKPLKQWFKQWGVPPWQRERIPQVYVGETLVALVTSSGIMMNTVQLNNLCPGLALKLKRPPLSA